MSSGARPTKHTQFGVLVSKCLESSQNDDRRGKIGKPAGVQVVGSSPQAGEVEPQSSDLALLRDCAGYLGERGLGCSEPLDSRREGCCDEEAEAVATGSSSSESGYSGVAPSGQSSKPCRDSLGD